MRTSLFVIPCALAALVPAALSAQVGSVLRAQRVNEAHGGFGGALVEDDFFGASLAALGDLNGDGTGDLAVGAPNDDDGGPDWGAVWILFLNPDATVLGQQKISQVQGGFGGFLADEAYFGGRVAAVGDLDGDGRTELAVLSRRPYRLWVLFLNADGTVRSQQEDFFTDAAFQPPTQPGHFGEPAAPGGLAALGDLDGDGLGDLALGAPGDPDGGGDDTGAVWIVRLAADGSLKATHKISQLHGGFTGTLAAGERFGSSIARLGDLDGNGARDLAVMSSYGLGLGSVWILYLDSAERVLAQHRYGPEDYGLFRANGSLAMGATDELAWLGDLDGDGRDELALECAIDFPDGPASEGGLALASLRADGSVAKRLRVTHQRGGLGDLPGHTNFGFCFAPLGDLDGDGAPELAVGAPSDRALGESGGGLWILSLATSAVRNGSGANPETLAQAAEPVFGASWNLTLDCGAHASGLAVLSVRLQRLAGAPTPFGEVLIGGARLGQLVALHAGGPAALAALVPPYQAALIDLPVFVQGLCTGAPGPRLSNALDAVVGR